MISRDDIEAFEEFNEPLTEKESDEKQKKTKDITEKDEYLTENSIVASFRLSF